MGTYEHHVIIVTATFGNWIQRAREEAQRLFPSVSPIMRSEINDVASFFIPPDGSFEEKPESDVGDDRRNQFVAWLDSQNFEDGSCPLDWVEVRYGDETPQIIRSSRRGHDPSPTS